jgi:alpha-L-fucosidase
VRELLTNYGPIGLIWFDTPKRMTAAQSRELVDFVHAIQPDCLVNGRIGNGLGDYAEMGDNRIPSAELQADWETPATINDTWAFKRLDNNWKSPGDLVHKLVDIASKGGNYLLNVGPTAEGVIPQPSVERMQAIGAWLQTNGAAVYDTQPGPLQGVDAYRTTQRGSTVYVHVFDWPTDGVVRLPALPGAVRAARLLAPAAPVEVQRDGAGWRISTGATSAPDPLDTVIALEIAA